MLATTSNASGIAGQLSTDETAWFTFPIGFVAKLAPKGFNRALVALGVDADASASATGSRSQPPHSGTGDAPYEHR